MTPAEMRSYLSTIPFKPFRLFMTDGMSYEIKTPTQAMATKYAIALGVDLDDEDNPQKVIYVDPHLVTRVEVDIRPSSNGNGRS